MEKTHLDIYRCCDHTDRRLLKVNAGQRYKDHDSTGFLVKNTIRNYILEHDPFDVLFCTITTLWHENIRDATISPSTVKLLRLRVEAICHVPAK